MHRAQDTARYVRHLEDGKGNKDVVEAVNEREEFRVCDWVAEGGEGMRIAAGEGGEVFHERHKPKIG